MEKRTKVVLKWVVAIIVIVLIVIVAKNIQGFINGFQSV